MVLVAEGTGGRSVETLARDLKADPLLGRLPIVFLIRDVRVGDVDWETLAVDDYITMPYSPDEVVRRAREVLLEHENAEARLTSQLASVESPSSRAAQLTIFTPLSQPVLEKLRETDLNRLTPLDALNLLAELKQQVQ